MITHISFDLDGTLADLTYDKLIWNEEIPKLYADKHNLSIEEAKIKVYAEYYKALYIDLVKNWTDIDMWFNRLGLDDWDQLLKDMHKHVFLFPETKEVLEALSKKHTLVIISDSEEKFLNIKLEAEGIKEYFTHVFSSPSTFNQSKKNRSMYEQILKKLSIKPENLLHVGDDHIEDYSVPEQLGIKALHIVRSKKMNEQHTIHNLSEIHDNLN